MSTVSGGKLHIPKLSPSQRDNLGPSLALMVMSLLIMLLLALLPHLNPSFEGYTEEERRDILSSNPFTIEVEPAKFDSDFFTALIFGGIFIVIGLNFFGLTQLRVNKMPHLVFMTICAAVLALIPLFGVTGFLSSSDHRSRVQVNELLESRSVPGSGNTAVSAYGNRFTYQLEVIQSSSGKSQEFLVTLPQEIYDEVKASLHSSDAIIEVEGGENGTGKDPQG